MRILAVRGRNLASLAREFALELDQPPLRDVGLFAITGPVGAGKSTLLDAICLALFDRTPRLSGRGGAELGDEAGGDLVRVHDARGVLRHDASDGFAEVEFVGTSGRRLRARWSLRRARQRLDGRLQTQEMALRDVASGAPLHGGRRTEVLAAIERELGLNFAQFRRSVLLAQGDFAAFLQASAAERAQLLERLTDAEVYRRLSKAAFERAKDERQRLQKLQAQFDEHRLLDEAARVELQAALTAATRDRKVAELGVKAAMQHVAWHETAERMREGESVALVALQRALAAEAEAAPRRDRAQRLRGALPFVVHRRVYEDAENAVRTVRATLAAAAAAQATAGAGVLTAQQRLAAALAAIGGEPTTTPPLVAEFTRWEPILEATAAAWDRQAAARDAVTEARRRLGQATAVRQEAEAIAATVNQKLGALLAAVVAHERDAAAPEFLALPDRRQRQAAARREFAQLEQAWSAAQTAAGMVAMRTERRERAAKTVAELQGETGRLAAKRQEAAAELRRVRDQARTERLRQGLAEHRHALRPGQPCPLCGASEHPWAEGAPADGDIDAAERAAETVSQAARDAEVAHREALIHAQSNLTEADGELRAAAAQGREAAIAWQALAAARGLAAEQPSAVTSWLRATAAALDGEDAAITTCDRLRQAAATRADHARAGHRACEGAARDATKALAEARELESAARADSDSLARGLESAGREVAQWSARLDQAWAGLVDAEAAFRRDRSRWLAAARDAAAAWRAQGEARTVAERAEAAVLAAGKLLHATQAEAATARSRFVTTLEEHGVDAADVERAAAADPRQFATEERLLRELTDTVVQARAVVSERAQNRQRHETHARPELDLAECRQALADATTAQNRESERLQELQNQQAVDDQARKHREELAPRLQRQQQTAQTWDALDELIGSASGDKFGVFAQGLTMDLLLDEANRRLADLAPRYRLQRIRQTDLDFAVVDRDLGNTLRSVRSLSGGETFLVSLALALALATLAAERTRIETLFLDEGFGTLDAQSLETALAALDALQATGCQVGVISHVEGFAERVGTVVEVRPDGSGQSRLFVRSGGG